MVIVERVLIVRVMDGLSLFRGAVCGEVLVCCTGLGCTSGGLGLVHCLYKYVSWARFLFLFLIIIVH